MPGQFGVTVAATFRVPHAGAHPVAGACSTLTEGGLPMTTIALNAADEVKVEEFAGNLFMACLGALELANVELGVRLNLYETLYGSPMTAHELSAKAGIAERYAQEWLEQQAVAGVL